MTAWSIDRFIAAAEESSQHAFQSLESIVRTFGSISMMLDSTLFAVFSSFRAVLGVADHFSRLRSHLGRVFSALAIFRTAKWAYHKLLYLLGPFRSHPDALFVLFLLARSHYNHVYSFSIIFARPPSRMT